MPSNEARFFQLAEPLSTVKQVLFLLSLAKRSSSTEKERGSQKR